MTHIKTHPSTSSPPILSVQPPRPVERWTLRVLIFIGLLAMGIFSYWFFQPQHIGHPVLYWILNIAVIYKFLRLLHEWYHYAGMAVPLPPKGTKEWKVDVLTTFCPGEPYDMIERSLKAIKAIQYPHETFLCDEGNDPFLKELCQELGVHHVYRGKDKTGAKAGNINYALTHQAEGEIAVILDPDHVPIPEFLDRTLPYFEDPTVGYVQSVQGYRNRNESFIAKGASEQTYQFYGPLMMSMNTYGTAQAIGANCVFRREALDSIDGHAIGLAEDMHTAMNLHAKGWTSVYIPEILTRGLVPTTLSAYYKQQLKWARGVFDLLFYRYPHLFKQFTWRQKLHYFTLPFHYISGLVTLIDLLVPVVALLFAISPWYVDLLALTVRILPLITIALVIRQFSQKWLLEEHERGFHFLGGSLHGGSWWIYLLGLVYTIFKIKVPYIPTPKNDEPQNALRLSLPNFLMIGISICAIVYGLSIDWNPYSWIMAGFAFTNVLMLTFVIGISQQKFLSAIYKRLYSGHSILGFLRSIWYKFRHQFLYRLFRNSYIIFAILSLTVLGSILFWRQHPPINLSRLAQRIPAPEKIEIQTLTDCQHVSLASAEYISDSVLHSWSSDSQAIAFHWDWDSSWTTSQLLAGQFDGMLNHQAEQLGELPFPIWFLPQFPIHIDPGIQASCWQYVHRVFQQAGNSNLIWVWKLRGIQDAYLAFPGDDFVDKILKTSSAIEEKFSPLSLTNYSSPPTLSQSTTPSSPTKNLLPFHIKGVSYDPSPQWYRGSSPLTRRQIEQDFHLIKKMGANTIRRYRSDVFDRNVLRIAQEKDLKVLFGFEIHADQIKNPSYLKDKKARILQAVHDYKQHPAVLAWNLGNETWSQIRAYTHQPDRFRLQTLYLQFIESLIQDIKGIDPHHPVMLSLDGGKTLPAALSAYAKACPSLDLIGVNALYEEHLSRVDSFMHIHLPHLPYLITEFGPDGYWDRQLSRLDSIPYLQEPSSYEKAKQYIQKWKTYIKPGPPQLAGGIAHAWRDVQEGTSTWFGLIDREDRRKPAFYSLQSIWTGKISSLPMQDLYISPPDPLWYRRPILPFYVVGPDVRRTDLTFEWYLQEEQLDQVPLYEIAVGKGRKVEITVPSDDRPYRLYLYVSDQRGNVVSSSQIINP